MTTISRIITTITVLSTLTLLVILEVHIRQQASTSVLGLVATLIGIAFVLFILTKLLSVFTTKTKVIKEKKRLSVSLKYHPEYFYGIFIAIFIAGKFFSQNIAAYLIAIVVLVISLLFSTCKLSLFLDKNKLIVKREGVLPSFFHVKKEISMLNAPQIDIYPSLLRVLVNYKITSKNMDDAITFQANYLAAQTLTPLLEEYLPSKMPKKLVEKDD